jgi:hypothetical protein
MSFRSGVCRGGAIVGLAAAVVLPLATGASPAGAAPAVTTTRSAVVSWVPTGPGTPNVSLQVDEETGPTGSSVFFFVNESYCDVATDTEVFLSYLAEGPETNQLFVVARNLSNAVLVAPKLSVNFNEQTAPECDTNGTDLTTVFSGPKTVALFGYWRATGPATPTFPGEVVRAANAAVIALAPPPLTLSNLGPPAFAQISQFTPQ